MHCQRLLFIPNFVLFGGFCLFFNFSILVLTMMDSYPKAAKDSTIWQSLLWHQVCGDNIARSITTQALTFWSEPVT